MDTLKVNKKNTLMIAHRGLSGIELENTNAAFIAAGNRSYYGIETDVHKTKDGKYIIIHDDNTGRVSKKLLPVEESSFDELRSLALVHNENLYRKDLCLPSLNDYVETCKRYDKVSVLELKNEFTQEEIMDIINVFKEDSYLDKVIFISFFYENLQKVRNILPDSKVQYLTCEISEDLINKLKNDKFDIDTHYSALNKENIINLHNSNIKINCWTVDSVEIGQQLIDLGVDYITSNILE